ncbi:MAG: IS3 family transposase [Erysipelotrichaceae bacterium]|nr:IS3 family transposase [Erysipelotrichaceae bacterium]
MKYINNLKIYLYNIFNYYNTQRITVKLKGLTPAQYRNQSLLTT